MLLASVLRRLRQGDCYESEASLGYIVRYRPGSSFLGTACPWHFPAWGAEGTPPPWPSTSPSVGNSSTCLTGL